VHTRMPTLGTPRDNSNNHPLVVIENGTITGNCAIVHNGMVSNHEAQFKKMSLARKATVDSDIIRAICDKEGLERKTIRELSKLSGSIAAAIVDKRKPNSLLLLRSGNPICLAVNSDMIIFASLQKVVASASKTWLKYHGIWARKAAKDLYYSNFPADSAWFIGPSGLEWHQEFKTAMYTYEPGVWRGWHGHDLNSYDEFNAQTDDVSIVGIRRNHNHLLTGGDLTSKQLNLICPKCKYRSYVPDHLRNTERKKLFCNHNNCNESLEHATEVYLEKGAA